MKRRVVFLLILITSILSADFWLFSRIGSSDSSPPTTPTGPPPPPVTLRPRPRIQHDEKRFDQLDPELKAVALRLETSAERWDTIESAATKNLKLRADLWLKRSVTDLQALETSQVAALAKWTASCPDSEADRYREALFIVWSMRDPATARSWLLGCYDQLADKTPGLQGVNPLLAQLEDDFFCFEQGYSMIDPKGAWAAFLQDEQEEGDAEKLIAGRDTALLILENYARKDPAAVLEMYLAAPDSHDGVSAMIGFSRGAPQGMDWPGIARRLEASRWSEDISPYYSFNYSPFLVIASCWLRDDPHAALDWYVRHASYEAYARADFHTDGGIKDLPLPDNGPEGRALALQVHLLDHAVLQGGDSSKKVASAVARLISDGRLEEREAIRHALDRFARADWLYADFLPVVTTIRSPAIREELLLKFLVHLPEHSRDGIYAMPCPNPCLEPTRRLIGNLEMTAATRKEVEAIIEETERMEAENLRIK